MIPASPLNAFPNLDVLERRVSQLEQMIMVLQSMLLLQQRSSTSEPKSGLSSVIPTPLGSPYPSNFLRGAEPQFEFASAARPRSQPDMPTPEWRPVYHALEKQGCGGIAQYLTRAVSRSEPASGDLLRIFDPAHPDKGWFKPDGSMEARCSACGRSIDPSGPQDLDWSGVFIDTDPAPPPEPPAPPPPPTYPVSGSFDASILFGTTTPRAQNEQQEMVTRAMGAARAAGYQIAPPNLPQPDQSQSQDHPHQP